MAQRTWAVVLTALLAAPAECGPFRGWGPLSDLSHPGWFTPSVYTPEQPETGLPSWPGFTNPWQHYSTEATSTSSESTTSSKSSLTTSTTGSTSKASSSLTSTSISVSSSSVASTSSAILSSSTVPITSSTTAKSTGVVSSGSKASSSRSSGSAASSGLSTKSSATSSVTSAAAGSSSVLVSIASASSSTVSTGFSGTISKSRSTKSACPSPKSKSISGSIPLSSGKVSASTSTKSGSGASGSASLSSKPASNVSGSTGSGSGSASVASSSRTTSVASTGAVSSGQASRSKSTLSACPSPKRKSTASGSASISTVGSSSGVSISISASKSRASGSVSRASGSVISTAPTGTSSLSPCGSVSQLVASTTLASGQAYPTIPAAIAYACLNTIPFNQSAAIAYMDSVRPYLNWQTTIEYLKSPPAEYAANVQAPYDFYAQFNSVYNNAVAGTYASEYAFGFDLYTAFQRAHDGHFVLYPDSVTSIFTFGRQTPLVSVSLDGTSVPEIFAYSDILLATFDTSFTPSAITTINGQDSVAFLLSFSEIGSLQDPDALWNNAFYELAQIALGASGTGTGTFSGGGRGRLIYPGPNTTLGFANGTSATTQNFARVLKTFKGVSSGADVYQKYLTVPSGEPESAEYIATYEPTYSTVLPTSTPAINSTRSIASATTTVSRSTTTIPAPGYPTNPAIREMNNLNSGYFLDGAGYEDVAVLAVNSFVGTLPDEIPFQSVNTYLINQAVANNKTKLVIDLSANGGGTILQGYDLFKQLFPSVLPYGATRFRAHEAVDLIGQEISAYSEQFPRSLSDNDTVQNIISSVFNYQTDADINYEPFTSWPEKYGPHAYGPEPDNFTNIIRWNLSDVLTPDNSGGIYVSGYLNRSNITTQPFAPENIVVVTDGYCASTCTIFSELMRQQGGVKYIALGGRPDTNIIQAVGGVKGTNDFEYVDIISYVEQVFYEPQLETREYYEGTVLANYTDLPLIRSTASVVNFRDGIREGDVDETPLQFVYEPADCRIFYTPEMTVDISASWKAAADTAFRGINHCVAGSIDSTATRRRSATRRASPKKQFSSKEKRALIEGASSVFAGQGNAGIAESVMII